MSPTFEYTCKTCGETHKGAPSFSFSAPSYYNAESKDKNQAITSDFYRTKNSFFIRTVLEIPIIGSTEPFLWGVWVSQSEENFKYYAEHFNDDLSKRETFGWFSNRLPYYADTLSLEMLVKFQNNGDRPKLHPKESEHELSRDFHDGISMEKTIKIANIASHKQ